MSMRFSIIGGDVRNIKLAKMLAEDGNKISTYGLEKAEELKGTNHITFCEELKEALQDTEIVIGPVPFSSDGKNIKMPFSDKKISILGFIREMNEKVLIAGSIQAEVYDFVKGKTITIIDIMQREELAILNTISTAEGAIEIAISNTERILHGSKILILGFGRIGKVLARKLEALSAKVTCAARKEEDLAWIKAYGYQQTNINQLGENLSQYDMIINTVPHRILTSERLQHVKKECLLIDLASSPGGIDPKVVKERELKLVWALALPGKIAPVTTAEFMKNTIYHIVKEKKGRNICY